MCNLVGIRPLDTSIDDWAERAGLQSFPRQITNLELHDCIAEYDVIASKPSSKILCLTPPIALKASPPSSIRYLETYESILKHAPDIPAANPWRALTTNGSADTFMRRLSCVSLDILWGSMGLA